MTGAGPALQIVGTHDGTADPNEVDERIWAKERLPIVNGLEIRGGHSEAIGIRLTGTMQAILRDLLIRDCRVGVELCRRNRNVIIDSCQIYDNLEYGIDDCFIALVITPYHLKDLFQKKIVICNA